MEAFKKHKIKHISASNINTFITNPAEWVINYIYKLPFASSAAAERGKYIEKALFHILGNGVSVEKALEEQTYFFAETCKEMKVDKEEYLKEKEFVEKAFGHAYISGFWQGEGLDEKFLHEGNHVPLVEINKDFYRPAEVELLYGNADPAREQLGWKPEISFDKLVQRMVECDLELEHAKR